jgi:hypothetical protein
MIWLVSETCKINAKREQPYSGDFNLPGWDWKNEILKHITSHKSMHYNKNVNIKFSAHDAFLVRLLPNDW